MPEPRPPTDPGDGVRSRQPAETRRRGEPPRFEAIDVGYQGLAGAANVFLLRSEGPTILVESGPQACLPIVERALRDRGVDPAAIEHVFVTHIHLDHAGAAGAFAARGAIVHAHPLGAPHLVDPTKLVSSSRRVHGEAYERWYGDPIAAAPERVHATADGERVSIGGLEFRAIETPGHAKHHHAWLVRHEGAGSVPADRDALLFTGDAAATFVPGSRFIGIPTPPPEYDLEAWFRSIERMRGARPAALVLTHGGRVDDPDAHLRAMRARLVDEDAWLRAMLAGTGDDEEVLRRYRPWLHAQSDSAGVPERSRDVFIGEAWMRMNIMGVRRAMAKAVR